MHSSSVSHPTIKTDYSWPLHHNNSTNSTQSTWLSIMKSNNKATWAPQRRLLFPRNRSFPLTCAPLLLLFRPQNRRLRRHRPEIRDALAICASFKVLLKAIHNLHPLLACSMCVKSRLHMAARAWWVSLLSRTARAHSQKSVARPSAPKHQETC